MVNLEIQGKVYPPGRPYLVGREKVREFARAVLSDSPLHHDLEAARGAGFFDLVAPPTFAIVLQTSCLQQLLYDPEANLDYSRTVHGEQSFRYSRPIVAGDQLTASMSVVSVREAGGHTMVTTSTEIHDVCGEHVVTTTSTLVVRGDKA